MLKSTIKITCVICDQDKIIETDFPFMYSKQSVRGRWICKECKSITKERSMDKLNDREFRAPDRMVVYRVPYGNKACLPQLREYAQHPGGPVGTQSEILDYAKKVGYDEVVFKDSINIDTFIKKVI